MRQSGRLRVPILAGLLAGIVSGVLQGIIVQSILAGVVSGLIQGVLMAVIFASSPFGHVSLAGLGYRQQREVAQAVRCGRAVSDPALADATVRYARQVRQRRMHDRALALRLAWGLLGASVLGFVAALALSSATGLIAAGVSVVVWIVVLIAGPILERRIVANAVAAEEATRALLGGNATGVRDP